MEHISGERDMKKREEIKELMRAAIYFEDRAKTSFMDEKDKRFYILAHEALMDKLERILLGMVVNIPSGLASFNYPFLTGMTVKEKQNE